MTSLHEPHPIMEIYDKEGNPIEVRERKATFWSKLGGGPLMFAALFHIILLMIGAFWIFQIVREKEVSFMPPGGQSGERSAEHKVQSRQRVQISQNSHVPRII